MTRRSRPRTESQTHIRVYRQDKAILERVMRRKQIKSQAEAFRWILRRKLRRRP